MVRVKCVCQACFDNPHLCKHHRYPTSLSREALQRVMRDHKVSVYTDTFMEHAFKPPPLPYRPGPTQTLLIGPMSGSISETQAIFTAPRLPPVHRERFYVYKPLPIPMQKTSIYTDDYIVHRISKQREAMQYWKRKDIEAQLAREKPQLESIARHPPRPYDYTKCEDPHGYPIFYPKMVKKPPSVEEENVDCIADLITARHSDEAPCSYVHGSSMKQHYGESGHGRHHDPHYSAKGIPPLPCSPCRPTPDHYEGFGATRPLLYPPEDEHPGLTEVRVQYTDPSFTKLQRVADSTSTQTNIRMIRGKCEKPPPGPVQPRPPKTQPCSDCIPSSPLNPHWLDFKPLKTIWSRQPNALPKKITVPPVTTYEALFNKPCAYIQNVAGDLMAGPCHSSTPHMSNAATTAPSVGFQSTRTVCE